MVSFEQHLKEFFVVATSALQREDEFLRESFSQYEDTKHYLDWPHGIPILFEVILVYLIFRELLSRKFSLEVLWEHEYPSNRKSKADLVLRENRGGISREQAFIEFKIWKRDDAKEIEADIEKLKGELGGYNEVPTRAFVLLFWSNPDQNEESDNLEWLKENLEADFIMSSSFWTRVQKSKYHRATLALFEVGL